MKRNKQIRRKSQMRYQEKNELAQLDLSAEVLDIGLAVLLVPVVGSALCAVSFALAYTLLGLYVIAVLFKFK